MFPFHQRQMGEKLYCKTVFQFSNPLVALQFQGVRLNRASRIRLLSVWPICYPIFEVFLQLDISCVQEAPIMPTAWKISGSYFEACNCDLACPCLFLSPPTSGECTLLLAWHIDQGRFGEVNLDEFNTALAVYAHGHMLEVKWKVAFYVDERWNKGHHN